MGRATFTLRIRKITNEFGVFRADVERLEFVQAMMFSRVICQFGPAIAAHTASKLGPFSNHFCYGGQSDSTVLKRHHKNSNSKVIRVSYLGFLCLSIITLVAQLNIRKSLDRFTSVLPLNKLETWVMHLFTQRVLFDL